MRLERGMKKLIKEAHLVSLVVLAHLSRVLEQKTFPFSTEIPVQSSVYTL